MRKVLTVMASAALLTSAAPALAQVNSGLVVVNLTGNDVNVDALNNLAQNLNVTVQDIQALNNVQVPIGLAAAICNVNANVLAQQKKSGNSGGCAAKNNTKALARAVQQKMGK